MPIHSILKSEKLQLDEEENKRDDEENIGTTLVVSTIRDHSVDNLNMDLDHMSLEKERLDFERESAAGRGGGGAAPGASLFND
ncbi:unnamed protein product [Cercopithifilaria johnstoni]|uniref:Uncharacterized protein n=1 Tax=Cercopithifilaria johnstoni TaxID=2874296 RepID=A0A8J2LX43_9BILA|nr:unnamed protein product [Cercopithifilaria johnstoni]